MSSVFTSPLPDVAAERARREHDEQLRALQKRPGVLLEVLPNIELADGAAVYVKHGLGRAPRWAAPSIVRGAVATGRIDELREGVDRTKYIVLQASGFGATITIDLAVL